MKRFKKFYLEITSVCNLACTFCPETLRPKAFISINQFKERLKEIKPYTDYLNFHVKGEPLLHPKLAELLSISHMNGFKVNITTNGTLISKKKSQLLNQPALRQINFSLHSFEGQPFKIDGDRYLEDILAFVKELKQTQETFVSFRLWNLQKHEETSELQAQNIKILQRLEEAFHIEEPLIDRISPTKGIKLSEGIYLNQDYQFTWPSLDEPEDDGVGFCHGLRNQVGILTDGTVIPCCLDGEGVINLGNVDEMSFKDIITSQRSTAIVEGFSKRIAVEELCKKCGYRKRFG
ncbi:radical SAM protein [Halolactibacillus alkaliphilus]|uniref:Radical SAM protein n=1 Tax=Halolactibacillus alkaliphilus TaxID=442899 RepID=A0A511X0U5_9BACI|nr:radical SAM/SPASM domain-containing protein [Halolactibacillus alkaliphilus]GEN56565.1 radical SAM protein [Halolactibacillus alkaliphilus]GGN69247.1 radical SAM protein [Halolactibacillus alkaliphilus]SFO75246.1 radical SAM additional 4Fe4S-binding SPASM domain-containing protein [Halolactibacillus alkaliphilus]